MVQIEAFKGLRYELGHVGALSDVIAPPYDVIGAELQNELYTNQKHRNDSVNFEKVSSDFRHPRKLIHHSLLGAGYPEKSLEKFWIKKFGKKNFQSSCKKFGK